MREAAAAIAAIGVIGYAALKAQQASQVDQGGESDDTAPPWWSWQAIGQPDPEMTDDNTIAARRAAFLMTIRWSEGTAGPNGYRTIFGGQLFSDFSAHPMVYVPFTDQAGNSLKSSAAGAYQFIFPTWSRLRGKLRLPDFSPASQDLAALELIREAGALSDVDAGLVPDAIAKIRRIWASLPGAGYNQPERGLSWLLAKYQTALNDQGVYA